ncbi:MAG: transglycosylase SLT domain-containing protein [Firmicutes bacterium]|nr:transglycosylase SLT domain-containing protein [Bacillota bacterium]
MRSKPKWLYGTAALSVLAVVSLTVYSVSFSEPRMGLADAKVQDRAGNPTLAEAAQVREFIMEQNFYLTEPEINKLTMAFLEASRKHGVDLWLLLSVAASESHFRANVVSSAGCIGIMQIKPSTARSFGVDPKRLYDPVVNIDLGTRYLKQLLDRYKDISLAIAAYNAGPSRVRTTIPSIRETRQYVSRVASGRTELIAREQRL